MNKQYKTTKKYKCPYCDYRAQRGDLVNHVGKDHDDELPQDYSPARAVYDSINGKNYGICMICKKKVYIWNDKVCRYNNLCDNPKCRAKVRETAVGRNIKVYNKPHLLNDPEQQEKMLANRKISGKYTYSDGGVKTYTGQNEKKTHEFFDKVLGVPSKDIESPGPVLTYEYNGETHKWITDIYYIPANLIIEVKDGGSNPNTRPMQSYREKQVAKEVMITEIGKFNYLRLTDNNFAQLLDVLADIKLAAIENNTERVKIHINEMAGGTMPRHGANDQSVIVPYSGDRGFQGFAFSNPSMEDILSIDTTTNKIIKTNPKDFYEKNECGESLEYIGPRTKEDAFKYIIEHKDEPKSFLLFMEAVIGRPLMCYEEALVSGQFRRLNDANKEIQYKLIESGVEFQAFDKINKTTLKRTATDYVMIGQDEIGYFAYTPDDYRLVSNYYDSDRDIPSEIIDLMNDMYKQWKEVH